MKYKRHYSKAASRSINNKGAISMLDMSKMKAKLDALENQGGGSQNDQFLKLEEGDTNIRIVPVEDGDPFKEKFFHYGLGRSILCPQRNFGKKCPVCDFVRTLYDDGSEESKKMAREIRAKQRFYSPVVIRGQEDSGVKVWGYGKLAYKQLINLVLDPDYGDITDVDSGIDLKITYKLPTKKGEFAETTITPRRASTKLGNKSEVAEILGAVPDFGELFESKSYEDIKAALDQYVLGDEPEAASTETEKFGNKTEASSVDEAFKALAS
jgi:hypothetical protein